MGIEIHNGFFKNRADVLDDLKTTKFWPTTFVSGPSPGAEVHWHSHEVHAYVVEGHTSSLGISEPTYISALRRPTRHRSCGALTVVTRAAPPAARSARGSARAGWRRVAAGYCARSAALAAERRSFGRRDWSG